MEKLKQILYREKYGNLITHKRWCLRKKNSQQQQNILASSCFFPPLAPFFGELPNWLTFSPFGQMLRKRLFFLLIYQYQESKKKSNVWIWCTSFYQLILFCKCRQARITRTSFTVGIWNGRDGWSRVSDFLCPNPLSGEGGDSTEMAGAGERRCFCACGSLGDPWPTQPPTPDTLQT